MHVLHITFVPAKAHTQNEVLKQRIGHENGEIDFKYHEPNFLTEILYLKGEYLWLFPL